MGHWVGEGRYDVDTEKVEAIRKMADHTMKKELHSILDMLGFYSLYVPLFSEIALPQTELTGAKCPKVRRWGDEHRKALNQLTECLCTNYVMYSEGGRHFCHPV